MHRSPGLLRASALRRAKSDEDTAIIAAETARRVSLLGLVQRRLISSQGPEERGACQQLRAAILDGLGELLGTEERFVDGIESIQTRTAHLILRTHVLRCEARLLNDAAAALRQRPSGRNAAAAATALSEVTELLGVLLDAVSRRKWGSAAADGAAGAAGPSSSTPPSAASARSSAPNPTKEAYQGSLRSELAASGLLDAWAGCYLALAQAEDGGRTELLADLFRNLQALSSALGEPGCAPCGRTLVLLLLAYLLQLCAALDGRSTGVQARLPDVGLLNAANGPLKLVPANAPASPASTVLLEPVSIIIGTVLGTVLGALANAPRPVPLGPLAAAGLRVAEALACAEVAGDRRAAHAQAARKPPRRALLPADTALIGAMGCLGCDAAFTLLEGPPATPASVQARLLPRAWAVVTAVALRATAPAWEARTQSLRGQGSSRSAVQVDAAWMPCVESAMAQLMSGADSLLGGEPCAEVRAMLEAGFLPAYERILVLLCAQRLVDCKSDVWAQVLAHGPRQQVFSLLRSMAEEFLLATQLERGLEGPLAELLSPSPCRPSAPPDEVLPQLDPAALNLRPCRNLLDLCVPSVSMLVSRVQGRGMSNDGAGEALARLGHAASYLIVHVVPLLSASVRRAGSVARLVCNWGHERERPEALWALVKDSVVNAQHALTMVHLAIIAAARAATEVDEAAAAAAAAAAGEEAGGSEAPPKAAAAGEEAAAQELGAARAREAEWRAFLLERADLPSLLAAGVWLTAALTQGGEELPAGFKTHLSSALSMAAILPGVLRLPPSGSNASPPAGASPYTHREGPTLCEATAFAPEIAWGEECLAMLAPGGSAACLEVDGFVSKALALARPLDHMLTMVRSDASGSVAVLWAAAALLIRPAQVLRDFPAPGLEP